MAWQGLDKDVAPDPGVAKQMLGHRRDVVERLYGRSRIRPGWTHGIGELVLCSRVWRRVGECLI